MALINIQYTADIQQLNAKLDQIIQKQEQLISSSQKVGKEMSEASNKASQSVLKLNGHLDELQGMIASAFAVSGLIKFTSSLVDAERKMELLQNRLNFLTGSSEKGEELFSRLFQASKRLGIGIEDLAEGMASFGIAATQAGFSARKTEQIFMQVATGLRAAGASSLQTQRAFYALQQMMSKGVVAAEELRRQLGEALPGANELMVKAYNRLHPAQEITVAQFTKLQEEGKIISREVLPEFAKVIEESFAPALAGKTNSLDAAISRVNTEFLALKLALGNSDLFKFFADTSSKHLNRVNSILINESIPAIEKFLRLTAEYSGLGAINNKEIEKQRALQAMTALESQRANEEVLKNAEEAMKLTEEQRKQKKQQYQEEIDGLQKVIDKDNKRRSDMAKAEAAVRRDYEQRAKSTQLTADKVKELERNLNRDLKAVKDEYFDYELSATARSAKKRIDILKGTLTEIEIEEKSSAEANEKARQESAAKERQRQEQLLKDAVALARIRVEQAQKGSIEENDARAELAKKQGDLDSFMAKSSAEAQLARVKSEKEANKQIEESRRKTEDALSQDVVEEDIDPSSDPALKRIDKELETYSKNSSKIIQAIAAPYLSAQDLEEANAKLKYQNLIALTKENSDERKMLEEALQRDLDNIRQRYADKEAKGLEKKIKEYARLASQIASQSSAILNGFAEADRQMRENQLEADLQILNARFEAGVLSEKDYNAKVAEIKREQFQRDKEAAIAKIRIDTALAVLNAFATLPWPLALLSTPFIIGLGAAQISAVESTPIPTFHEGGIAIGDGAKMTSGPLKSDEFIAKLQRGESVIDRQDTQKYKDELSAIREGKFEDYIASKYIVPALERSIDKKQTSTNATSMEMAFQAAEMVNAIKGNKVIKLHKSSIKELAGHIGPKATDKVLARRSWR